MTGLEKILENIAAEAQSKAEEILADARKQAQSIIDQSATEAGAQCAKIVEAARDEAELLGRISQSGSELNGRKMMLKTRREVLDETFSQALAALKAMPSDKYFAVLKKLAKKYAQNGDGELVLSAADRAKVPEGFIDEINASISGGRLALASDTVETGGGFILRYGGIEENCTFDAIAEQKKESISDELGSLLFG